MCVVHSWYISANKDEYRDSPLYTSLLHLSGQLGDRYSTAITNCFLQTPLFPDVSCDTNCKEMTLHKRAPLRLPGLCPLSCACMSPNLVDSDSALRVCARRPQKEPFPAVARVVVVPLSYIIPSSFSSSSFSSSS